MIKNNWFKITVIIILLGMVVVFYKKNNISVSELYNINSDCSQKVISFAKYKSMEFEAWNVSQSGFKNDICYGELYHKNLYNGTTHEIYDLTHTKALSFLPDFKLGDDPTTYAQYAKEYEKVKNNAFGITK